jgi:hypothetical protein
MVSAVAAMMAAMMVVIAAPAMAIDFDNDNHDFENFFGFGNGFFDGGLDQEAESGDVENNFRVSNTGDYAFQCTPAIQFGNTGNFNNGSSFVQFGSGNDDGFNDFGFFGDDFDTSLDDFEPEGIDVSFAPVQNTDCSNTIQQSSAADSGSSWWY